MPSTIALTVSRYRPEEEAEPSVQTYEVPYRKDWVVLDALNYIKDRQGLAPCRVWSYRRGPSPALPTNLSSVGSLGEERGKNV